MKKDLSRYFTCIDPPEDIHSLSLTELSSQVVTVTTRVPLLRGKSVTPSNSDKRCLFKIAFSALQRANSSLIKDSFRLTLNPMLLLTS